MQQFSSRFSSLSIFLAIVCTALAQESGPPTLFVAPLKPDTTLMSMWQPALGHGLAEMLITEITKLNKFQVLESTALEQLKDEIRLGEEGYVAGEEKLVGDLTIDSVNSEMSKTVYTGDKPVKVGWAVKAQ